MLAVDQIARNVSGRIQKSVEALYSADKQYLSDKDYAEVLKASEVLKKYPIYYVDTIGTVHDIKDTILSFVIENNIKERNRGLIVTLDHILLTRGKMGESEKVTLDAVMHMFVELKKQFSSIGVKIMFIVLSQLNRDIEKQDRVMNSLFHYPTKNDLFAASSVYYCSDVVIILHKPLVVEGIGKFYGPPRAGYPKGLPISTEENKPMIYWHIIKSRFGQNQILMMVDDFANSRVLEYVPPQKSSS